MNFPDRNHLLQLRRELWQRPHSRATVMVGAGFSQNARPSPGIDTRFPTWRELTRAMFDEIYPPAESATTDRQEQFSRSNPLRVATEYEAAFKRQKLESFLHAHVPDSGHQPGPMHELLLQLPWRDVFTTNYDTLLERTEVTERAYQPVMTVEDLTTAISSRIVKLHGTLPSQTPFIITEEDYRTYPRRFAPFVNTVRQSLIENSFVLIGFSGDDPNFIAHVVVAAPKFSDRFCYEQASWMMWNINRRDAKEALDKWTPSSDAILATMRKAGMLADLDALNQSQELLRTTLRQIRRFIYANVAPNLYLLSLEGWCTYLMYKVQTRIEFDNMVEGRGRSDFELRDRYSDRWQELKTLECSAWPVLADFQSMLAGERPGPSWTERVIREFDPESKATEVCIRATGLSPWLPAFACIRLYEQVGIPLRFSDSSLSNACTWVMQFNSFWSPALLILAGKIDRLKEQHLLDRTQIANMKGELALNIHQWALEALKRELSALTSSVPLGSHLGKLLEALIEVLSRLTIKVRPEELREAMSAALALCSEPSVQKHITLSRSCQSWTKRLLEAADEAQVIDWLPDMMRSIIPEEDRGSNSLQQWRDPVADVPVRLIDNGRSDQGDNSAIREAIEWLLNRARSATGETWRRMAMRLVYVHQSDVMTSDQETKMGSILWTHTARDGFPDLPDVDRVMFLYSPFPEDVNIVDKLKALLLEDARRKSVTDIPDGRNSVRDNADPLILALARASRPIIHVPYESRGLIEWTRKDTEILWTKVVEWWHNDKRALHLGEFTRTNGVVATARSAAMFLWRAVLPMMEAASEDEWADILAFLQDMRDHGVYPTTAWPYVLIHRCFEAHKVGRIITEDLSSDVEDAVVAGAAALRNWIHLGNAGLSERPPTEAIDALLHRVVFRRRIAAASCLRQLTLLLGEHPQSFDSRHADLMISSVTPWLESIQLPVFDGNDGGFHENERPDLRAHLGRFAAALSRWLLVRFPGRPEPEEITDLRDQYASDSLPEVRRSFDVRGVQLCPPKAAE